MSSIVPLSSQAVVLATAMALSGTVIFLALSRPKQIPSSQIPNTARSQTLRSCLLTDAKKMERKKKKVQFAKNVKDPIGTGEEFRKQQIIKKSVKQKHRICRTEFSNLRGIPENRVALYSGILKDRVERIECSY